MIFIHYRADHKLAPSQWETSLQSNAVSHWLGANLKHYTYIKSMMWKDRLDIAVVVRAADNKPTTMARQHHMIKNIRHVICEATLPATLSAELLWCKVCRCITRCRFWTLGTESCHDASALDLEVRINWAPSQYKDRLIYVWRFPC